MSFKDAFTKEGAGGNPLNYDDAAFAYFAATCLTCILVPWAYTYFENRLHIFSRVRRSMITGLCWTWKLMRWSYNLVLRRQKGSFGDFERDDDVVESLECKCSLCARKNQQLMAETPLIYRFIGTPSDYLQLIGIVLLACLVSFIASHYLNIMPNVATFNPWTILNITETAGERDIRKAFRTMSLKYHPDKNPNDASAAAQFLLISKAYFTLTNEVARRNFEKYGNPDGRTGMMKVGIGLPTFMLREDFQIFILAVFFITLLVIVPGCFLLYYHYISQFAPNGLKKDTVHLLGGLMSQKIHPHRVVALIAASREIKDLNIKATQADMKLLAQKCADKALDQIGAMASAEVLKSCWLIYVHLARQTHTLPTHLQMETRAILRQAIRISRAMLDIAFINNWIPAIQVILAVRKCLLQSVEIGSLPLTQIPHVLRMADLEPTADGTISTASQERCKTFFEGVRKFKPTDFRDLVRVALENKEDILKDFTVEEIEDIKAVYVTLPKIKFEGYVFVDDEDEICLGDVGTCRLTFTREHLAPNQVQGFIHSPFYPDQRKEEWFAFISDASTNELHGYKTFTDNGRTVVIDIQFPILKPGTWKMIAVVLSEAYFGVDRSVEFEFTAIHPQASKRKEFIHPDDVALDNQASLVQQILGTAALEEEDEDVDEEIVTSPAKPPSCCHGCADKHPEVTTDDTQGVSVQ